MAKREQIAEAVLRLCNAMRSELPGARELDRLCLALGSRTQKVIDRAMEVLLHGGSYPAGEALHAALDQAELEVGERRPAKRMATEYRPADAAYAAFFLGLIVRIDGGELSPRATARLMRERYPTDACVARNADQLDAMGERWTLATASERERAREEARSEGWLSDDDGEGEALPAATGTEGPGEEAAQVGG
jgi:hypothetical protein